MPRRHRAKQDCHGHRPSARPAGAAGPGTRDRRQTGPRRSAAADPRAAIPIGRRPRARPVLLDTRLPPCHAPPDPTPTPEPAMIDLYAMGSPNVVKIYIALEEMGLPYTVHPVDVFGEEQFKPEFL